MSLTPRNIAQLARLHAAWADSAQNRERFSAVGRARQLSTEGQAARHAQLERMATDPAIVLRRRVGQHLAWASMCEAKGRHARAVLHREKAEGFAKELAALGGPALAR